MNVTELGNEIKTSLKYYQDTLKELSEEEFLKTPAQGGWSISEVYCHVIQANTASLMAIEKCLHGKQSSVLYSLPIFTRIILFLGKFPPIKLKAPDAIASVVKKQSKEETRNNLIKLLHRIDPVIPKVAKSASTCRITHPRLGMLTSMQWVQFMNIHTRHHLKQVNKIKNS